MPSDYVHKNDARNEQDPKSRNDMNEFSKTSGD